MTQDLLASRLVEASSPGGGWPYYAAKQSRVEPTCWALMALGAEVYQPPHLAFLSGRVETASGLLIDPGSPEPNSGWTGLAMLAASALNGGTALRARLLPGVLEAKGVQLRPETTSAIPQNGMLQAWSWTPGTFSWVEPTAYCLIALKQTEQTDAVVARVDEAEAVLLDRVCPGGGWNYGNSAVLGQDLRPYVSTTALALLAMHDAAGNPKIAESLDWLSGHAVEERATMALALTALALEIFGRDPSEPLDALRTLGDETGYLENAHLMAMALYALTIERHDAKALRVPPRPMERPRPQGSRT